MGYTDEQIQFLVQLKETKDLTWPKIAEIWKKKFGEDNKRSDNALRHLYTRVSQYEQSQDTLFSNLKTTQSARKTSSKLRKENKAILDGHISAQEFLKELRIINETAKVTFHKQVKHSKAGKIERSVVAQISDTHIGCNIMSDAMGGINEYNSTVAARRFGMLFDTIANYKLDHRKETELILVLNGDIMAGVIHSQESVDPMSTQFSSALRIFSQGISYVSQSYKKVRVYCITGNHDRYMHKENKGRQSDQKWDSFATNLYVAIRERFEDWKNVEIDIPPTPYAIFKAQGHTYFATHGDTVLNPGNPGKKLEIGQLTTQINDFMAGLGIKIDVVLVGHVHKSVFVTLDNGVVLGINGTLSGTDDFAQSIGILSNNPEQSLFEVTKEQKVGDMRFIRLKKADKDSNYEKIVKPMKNIF